MQIRCCRLRRVITLMPKLERASTGKGMPYLVPGWAFRTIGMSVITLPTNTCGDNHA